jgi:beta-1,4-mannosyltransferase
VVHVHSLPYFRWSPIDLARYALFYMRLKRLRARGVRVVWTVHNFQNHDSTSLQVEDRVSRYVAGAVDALIVHGPSAKALVESQWQCPSRSISVIPHGHYIHSYQNSIGREPARASLGLEPSNIVFLFLGLIRPYKGVLDLVQAFKACTDPGARLVIAGRPVDPAIEAEVAGSIAGDPRIRFVPGFVKDDDVQMYMNASDVFVLPYRRVLTSGAAILAMSFAKACIAPRAGCVTDALDDQGNVLFDPAIEGDLARAVNEALSRSRELADMGQHNLRRASAWDWTRIGRATADVYARCVQAEGR